MVFQIKEDVLQYPNLSDNTDQKKTIKSLSKLIKLTNNWNINHVSDKQ